jgi:uncharacterized delta-60 repeat protein
MPLACSNQFSRPVRVLAPRNAALLQALAFLLIVLLASSTLALSQAGSLDTTFGSGGIFTTSFTTRDATVATAAAIQSDGKIIVAGSTPAGAALLRLNTNGTLDSSFGTNGIASSEGGVIYGLAIQSNGQIVVAASSFVGGTVGRFNSNGSVDTTFGSNGFVGSKSVDPLPGQTGALAVQANGDILVTGNGTMARYTTSGQLDTAFGTGGVAAMNSPLATAMAVLSDGKILITSGIGAPTLLNSSISMPVSGQAGAIARYNTNGTLDTTFGIGGQAACVASAAALKIQSGGKIVVAGTITSALIAQLQSDGETTAANQTGFGVVRYNSNGMLDSTFNHGGVITGFGDSFPAGLGFAVAVQTDGDIVVAGQAGNGNGVFTSSSFVLARYTSTGQLDTTFGTNGVVTTALSPGPISWVSALLLQSDGKIVAAGNTGSMEPGSAVDNFAVARYLAQQ